MTIDSPFADRVRNAIEQGNFEQAFSWYEQALQSGQKELRVEYAFLLWEYYEFPRAKELFQELALDSSTPILTQQAIAKCYFRLGRFDDAAQVMEQVVQRSPGDVELLLQFASCCERSDRFEPSLEACNQALAIEPSHQGIVRQLAHIERRQGDFGAAIDRLQQFLVEYSWADNWQARYELAGCLDRVGEYRDAWLNLVEAKTWLRPQSLTDLQISYATRKRQADVVQGITDVDWARWQRLQPAETQSIALMAGFPRSGTTLLETLLTSHPCVEGTDESGILLSQFTKPMIWDADDPMQAVIELRSFDQDQIAAGREHYLRCTGNVLGADLQNKLLIEKDPLLTCDLALPLRLFPEAKIIMPLRNPRDVIISYFFTMLPFAWSSSPATDIVESAKFYSDVINHWLYLRHRLPWASCEIRYEDLTEDPLEQTRRLSEFLELDFQPAMLDPTQRRKDKMVSTPTYDDVTKPIYRRAVGRWENYREFLEPALPILEPCCQALGY
jgi:thioredoxin-like negative regulator of GroEL